LKQPVPTSIIRNPSNHSTAKRFRAYFKPTYFKPICIVALTLIFSVGCVTAKSVSKAENIRDDGKSNIVVMSYDMKVYASTRHPTEKNIKVRVHCPQSSKLTAADCFQLDLPFKGETKLDDYSMHAFEANGTKIMRLKYGEYTATRAKHSVLIDRVPDVSWYSFPEPLYIPVNSGTGCYLGHFTLTVADGEIQDSTIEYNAELTPERLASIGPDIQAAVQQHVVRPAVP